MLRRLEVVDVVSELREDGRGDKGPSKAEQTPAAAAAAATAAAAMVAAAAAAAVAAEQPRKRVPRLGLWSHLREHVADRIVLFATEADGHAAQVGGQQVIVREVVHAHGRRAARRARGPLLARGRAVARGRTADHGGINRPLHAAAWRAVRVPLVGRRARGAAARRRGRGEGSLAQARH